MIRIAEIRAGLRKLSIGQPDKGTSWLVIQFYYEIKAERNLENTANLTAYGWGHLDGEPINIPRNGQQLKLFYR
jgi:hypothetical protein